MTIWQRLWQIGNVNVGFWDQPQELAPRRILLTGTFLGAIEGAIAASLSGGWNGACWGCLFGGAIGCGIAQIAWCVRHQIRATRLAILVGGLVELLGAFYLGWFVKNEVRQLPGMAIGLVIVTVTITVPPLVALIVCGNLIKWAFPSFLRQEREATLVGVVFGSCVGFAAGAILAGMLLREGALIIAIVTLTGLFGGTVVGLLFGWLSSLVPPRRFRE